jgi:hypothetical protein
MAIIYVNCQAPGSSIPSEKSQNRETRGHCRFAATAQFAQQIEP